MHLVLKTLLNRVERLKGFVYESSRLIEGHVPQIKIQLWARKRPQSACLHSTAVLAYDRRAPAQ